MKRPWRCAIYACEEREPETRGQVVVHLRNGTAELSVCRVHWEAILIPIGRQESKKIEARRPR